MTRTFTIVLSALALLVSIIATVNLLKAPSYRGIETTCTENGCETIETTNTLVGMNGSWVIYQLVIVILVSSLPLFAAFARPVIQRSVTWISALLLLVYSIAGGLSIGLAFMPTAILILVAGVVTLFIRKEVEH